MLHQPGGGSAASQKSCLFPVSTASSGPFGVSVSTMEEAENATDSNAARLRKFVAGFDTLSAEAMGEPTRAGMGQVETMVDDQIYGQTTQRTGLWSPRNSGVVNFSRPSLSLAKSTTFLRLRGD